MDSARAEPARSWTLALASIASFMVALDAFVVTMALGTIRRDLGASLEALEWAVNAYNLAARKNDAGLPVRTPAAAPSGQTTDGQAGSGQPATETTGQPASGGAAPAASGQTSTNVCERSAIVDVTADLIDFNVNQNAWISSMLLYKLGLFGIDWDDTPWLDNKASFQRGINQAVRRTTVELVDSLGRVRGTSGINNDLQLARGNIQFDEETWYFSLSPFGPRTPTPSIYRAAARDLRKFNASLETCSATFDARSDNLVEFLERDRAGMASTFVTRLKVGESLVDAKGVSRLVSPHVGIWPLAVFGAIGVAAIVGAVVASPALRNVIESISRAIANGLGL